MKIFLFLLSLYQQTPPVLAGDNVAVVPTASGKVRGYMHKGIYTFKGIPYGKAKRFMPPELPSSWQGIRSSMTYGPDCPAPPSDAMKDEFEFPLNRSRAYYTNEDCLSLNIWSKKINNTAKAPVMVWLHGGGFTSGSSVEFPSYDGENLSRKGNIVLVSINHRLNTFGFLDLSAYGERYKTSANVGAMDIVLALTWIRDNISNFGGDPDNVTIFGQSGGGAKVTCLLNAPSAKGLFHKAIIQSGSYITRFIEPAISRRVAAELLKILDLRSDQVDTLQTLPANRLTDAAHKAIESVKATLKPGEIANFGLEWEPVHDGYFLPYQPNEPAAIKLSENIPLLVGSCKNEYMPYILGPGKMSMDSAKVKLQKKYGDRTAAYMAAVKKAYPATVEPSDYIAIDLLFRPLVIKQADQRSLTGAAPVYVYLFAWQSPVLDGTYKAFHCMDLPFVFNNIARSEEMTGGGQAACLLAGKVSEAWIQFARHGNPNHKGLPRWPAYTAKNGITMIFDNNCQVTAHHDQELRSIAAGN